LELLPSGLAVSIITYGELYEGAYYAQDLYEKQHSIQDICRTLKISKATLYRYIETGERALDST
jgi:transposase-like protein